MVYSLSSYLLAGPAFVDLENHKATLFDEGDNCFISTSLSNIERAIAASLKHLAATVLGGEEYGIAYDVTYNKLLGPKELTKEKLKKFVANKLS